MATLISGVVVLVLWAIFGIFGHWLALTGLDAHNDVKLDSSFAYCCGICAGGLRKILAPLILLGPISFFLGGIIALVSILARPFVHMSGKQCILGRHGH